MRTQAQPTRFPSVGATGPRFGLRHTYLTSEEMAWVLRRSGRASEETVQQNIGHYDGFRSQYPDLAEFERLSPDEQLALDRIAPSVRPTVARCILILANYGRISMSLGYLNRRTLHSWPDDPHSLINSAVMDWITEAVMETSSSDDTRKATVTSFWRFLLWAGQPLPAAADQFEEYWQLQVAAYGRPGDSGLARLRTILAHQGFGVPVKPPADDADPWDLGKLTTNYGDIRTVYLGWVQHRSATLRPESIRGLLGNCRNFLNWLDSQYPDISSLSDLKRIHIREYIAQISDSVCPERRNQFIRSVRNWFDWLRDHSDFRHLAPSRPLVHTLDFVSETTPVVPEISTADQQFLWTIINGMDESQSFLPKMALLMLVDTGLRVHEILHLDWDCRWTTPDGITMMRVHKLKQGTTFDRPVGSLTIHCLERVQEYNSKFTQPVATRLDPVERRRLFIGKFGRSIMDRSTVEEHFFKAQLKAGLVDRRDPTEPRFTLHDIRRIYISVLKDAGTPDEVITALTGHGDPESMVPYDRMYEKANTTFWLMQERGLLVGRQETADQPLCGLDRLRADLIEFRNRANIQERQRLNLLRYAADPLAAFPVITGSCLGGAEIDCPNGPLACPGCESFSDTNPEKVDAYLQHVFRAQWERAKHGIEMPMINQRVELAIQNLYMRQRGMTYEAAKVHVAALRNSVVPKRGRPRKGQSESAGVSK